MRPHELEDYHTKLELEKRMILELFPEAQVKKEWNLVACEAFWEGFKWADKITGGEGNGNIYKQSKPNSKGS